MRERERGCWSEAERCVSFSIYPQEVNCRRVIVGLPRTSPAALVFRRRCLSLCPRTNKRCGCAGSLCPTQQENRINVTVHNITNITHQPPSPPFPHKSRNLLCNGGPRASTALMRCHTTHANLFSITLLPSACFNYISYSPLVSA